MVLKMNIDLFVLIGNSTKKSVSFKNHEYEPFEIHSKKICLIHLI